MKASEFPNKSKVLTSSISEIRVVDVALFSMPTKLECACSGCVYSDCYVNFQPIGSCLARLFLLALMLWSLENDNAAVEVVDIDDDEDASLDEEDQVTQRKHSRSLKRKTRQSKALENAKKAPQNFMELLQEANLEAAPPHVPTYLRAAVGPPSSTARRHFCSVCGYIAPYTCVQCGSRFCSVRCQRIHSDTRCLKFVA